MDLFSEHDEALRRRLLAAGWTPLATHGAAYWTSPAGITHREADAFVQIANTPAPVPGREDDGEIEI